MNKALSSAARRVGGHLAHQARGRPSRLSSEGFGLERPIDTNETAEGRQNNRRVEFHIDDEVTK